MSGELIDVVARHEKEPKLYPKPSSFELETIKVGDQVKLGVSFPPAYSHIAGRKVSEELFWVKITAIDGLNFKGTVETEMEFFDQHDIVEFEEVSFEQRHIMASK